MRIRWEVTPFIIAVVGVFGLLALITGAWWICLGLGVVGAGYLLYFFRDPERVPPEDDLSIVAAADGRVASVRRLREDEFLKTPVVRISIFLSLFDVHVNRAPMAGMSRFLGYYPGKRFFTFQEKSSELNQHNKILIEGRHTRCLVNQIVGPVCRRVVYWPAHEQPVNVAMGERIGMMKFGSRLDLYLPGSDVEILAKEGDRVRAGETPVARVRASTAEGTRDRTTEMERIP